MYQLIKRLKYNFFYLPGLVFFLGACRTTKYVPDDQYLLRHTEIEVDDTDEGKKLHSYIKQEPNKRIVGVPFHIWLYNWKNPKKEKGFRNWVSSNGQAPEITDTVAARRTLLQLEKYYFNRGYFNVEANYKIECKGRKSKVTYIVKRGPAYEVRNIEYTLNSPELDSIMNAETADSYLKSGIRYRVEKLDQERSRLTTIFQNNGFYDFTKEYIYFEVDSNIPGPYVDLLMGIENKKIASGDSAKYIPHKAFTLDKIYVVPGFNPRVKNPPPRDTLRYGDYIYLLNKNNRYRLDFLDNTIHLQLGELYQEKNITETKGHFQDIGVFRKVDIQFFPTIDTTQSNLEGYLFLQPRKRHTAGIEGEGTHSSGRFGIAGNLFYKNLNTYKGGEIFDVRLRGAVEFQPSTTDQSLFNAYEIGLEGRYLFPRFLLPFDSEKYVPSTFFPKTVFSLGYFRQIRTDFDRDLVRATMSYVWNPNKNIEHKIDLVDFNFVRLTNITDSTYINSQRIRTGYEDVFIPAIGYTYIFNNQTYRIANNYNYFRGHIELSGTLLNAFAPILGMEQNSNGQNLVSSVPISQYLKFEADNRYFYFVGGQRRRITVRYYGGMAIPFGNSSVIPFEKQFFTGGSNDLRGWVAYTQWPGSSFNADQTVNSGDIKILFMGEYRFGLGGNLEGGLFVDVGNIWLLQKDETLVGADFDIRRFYKEFGVSPGFGIRYDFSFFVFRLDAGVKLYQPHLPEGERWTPQELSFRRATWSIALGYPF